MADFLVEGIAEMSLSEKNNQGEAYVAVIPAIRFIETDAENEANNAMTSGAQRVPLSIGSTGAKRQDFPISFIGNIIDMNIFVVGQNSGH
jgi:hypothetical protein